MTAPARTSFVLCHGAAHSHVNARLLREWRDQERVSPQVFAGVVEDHKRRGYLTAEHARKLTEGT